MNKNMNESGFYLIIEDNSTHTDREISAFDATLPFSQIEKLANCLFQYYEYLGFSGNKSGVSVLPTWQDYAKHDHLTFDISTSTQPVLLSGASELLRSNELSGAGGISRANEPAQNLSGSLRRYLCSVSNLSMKELAGAKINFYDGLEDFFAKNSIYGHSAPALPNTQDGSAYENHLVSSMPVFDLMGHDSFLINVQGSFESNKPKQNLGSVIMTDEAAAQKLSLALTQYYLLNNLDVGVLLRPISSFQALDMVLGKVPDFSFTNYYTDLADFLNSHEAHDFEFLQNQDLQTLGYLEESDFTAALKTNARTYFEPTMRMSGHDRAVHLISFSDQHEAGKYLSAYLLTKTPTSSPELAAKVQTIQIFGNIEGMDLDHVFVGDVVFGSIPEYLKFVEASKRRRPLDMDSSTFDKLKLNLSGSFFGE